MLGVVNGQGSVLKPPASHLAPSDTDTAAGTQGTTSHSSSCIPKLLLANMKLSRVRGLAWCSLFGEAQAFHTTQLTSVLWQAL